MPNWSLISIRDLSGDKGSFEIYMWVSNPTKMSGDEEAKEKVVAVISNIYWAGGHANPMYIGCRISTENKAREETLRHTRDYGVNS